MARGKTANVNVEDVVKMLESNGCQFVEKKVTVGMYLNKDNQPVYTTPDKEGKFKENISKSETRIVKVPTHIDPTVIGDNAGKIIEEYLRNKLVLKTQADIKSVLAGPEKALADIEETIKKMGLPEDIAAQVRATLLAGLQTQG